jgi:hypothetical protein
MPALHLCQNTEALRHAESVNANSTRSVYHQLNHRRKTLRYPTDTMNTYKESNHNCEAASQTSYRVIYPASYEYTNNTINKIAP